MKAMVIIMKLTGKVSVLSALCLLLLCFVACNTHGLFDEDFDAGDPVTPEQLLEISEEIFSATEPAEGETKTEVTLADDAIVLCSKNGSVYHSTRACYHISDSAEIIEGSVADAVAAGKTRLCSTCRDHEENTDEDDREEERT